MSKKVYRYYAMCKNPKHKHPHTWFSRYGNQPKKSPKRKGNLISMSAFDPTDEEDRASAIRFITRLIDRMKR